MPIPLGLLGHIRRSSVLVVKRAGTSRIENSHLVAVTYVGAEVVLLNRNEHGVRDHVPPFRATKVQHIASALAWVQ